MFGISHPLTVAASEATQPPRNFTWIPKMEIFKNEATFSEAPFFFEVSIFGLVGVYRYISGDPSIHFLGIFPVTCWGGSGSETSGSFTKREGGMGKQPTSWVSSTQIVSIYMPGKDGGKNPTPAAGNCPGIFRRYDGGSGYPVSGAFFPGGACGIYGEMVGKPSLPHKRSIIIIIIIPLPDGLPQHLPWMVIKWILVSMLC